MMAFCNEERRHVHLGVSLVSEYSGLLCPRGKTEEGCRIGRHCHCDSLSNLVCFGCVIYKTMSFWAISVSLWSLPFYSVLLFADRLCFSLVLMDSMRWMGINWPFVKFDPDFNKGIVSQIVRYRSREMIRLPVRSHCRDFPERVV